MFNVSADNLDDLMGLVFKKLLSNRGVFRVESTKGKSTEVFEALLELKNPRARLSRSQTRARIFSAIGELIWYLAGEESIDFIEYYIPGYRNFSNDGKIASGAYGPRLFGLKAGLRKKNQSEWNKMISTLRRREGSRNALIQIYSNSDAYDDNKDRPCTCSLHFVIRNSKLHLHVHMRSNDAYKGLPHDIFSFTMLQEIASCELGLELGTYQHSVASLHLYDDETNNQKGVLHQTRTNAKKFLDEGLHDFKPMPNMPKEDPWISIEELIIAEKNIRAGNIDFNDFKNTSPYWKDFAILLKIHSVFEMEDKKAKSTPNYSRKLIPINELSKSISSSVYKIYILDKLVKKSKTDLTLFNYGNIEG